MLLTSQQGGTSCTGHTCLCRAGRLVTGETLSTIADFFELASLDYTTEIHKLLVCAPLSPVQATFYTDGVEEKVQAIKDAPVSRYPLLGEMFQVLKSCELCNRKQPWLLYALPLHDASVYRTCTKSQSSSHAEVPHAASLSRESHAHSRDAVGNSPSVSPNTGPN